MEDADPTIASLLGCPEDVCHSVFPYLSRADLHNICLVHTHLRDLAEPCLYSEIHLDWQEHRPHPITSLLRSILRRPQLASYVRTVSLTGNSFHTWRHRGKTPKIPVSEPELEEPIAFVEKAAVSYREARLEGLRSGSIDAFVAVLISQPLRLTRLLLGSDILKESQYVGSVLRSMLCVGRDCGLRLDFEHLQIVSFERHFDSYACRDVGNTADLLPLFYLPSLRRISAAIDNPPAFVWPAAHPPSCSSLRSMKLTSIREPFLGQLLAVADQLQFLHWEWYYNPKFKDRIRSPVIDLTQITTAIFASRATLAELVISASCDRGGDIEFPSLTIRGSWKAMAGFDDLRKFTAPIPLLVGFSADLTKRIEDALPQRLEFLTITDDLYLHEQYEWEDYEFLSVVKSWLETFRASTPHLCGIALFFRDMDDTWNQPIRDELRELCVRAGIQLEVNKLSTDLY